MSMVPSKKVLSFFVLSAAATFSVITVFGNEKTNTNSGANLANTLTPGEKISLPQNPNWQNDFDTISSSYTTNTQSQAEQTPEEQTTTDAVATSLLSNYLVLKQNGLLNQSSAQKLVDQSVNFVDQLEENTPWKITVRTTPDNGAQSLTLYGENLGAIFKRNMPTERLNELEIVTNAINQENQSEIEELAVIIGVYENIYTDLAGTEVPSNLLKPHVEMLKGMSEIVSSLDKMMRILSDPLVGLQAIKTYQEGGLQFATASQAIRNFLLQNNIVYEQGSGGYYFLYGI